MADYDSALPIRGNVTCGEAVDANNTSLVVSGSDGTNYQCISVDTSGYVNTNTTLGNSTNTIGKVEITDGTSDLPLAVDGTAEKAIGIEVYGSDGTNNYVLLTDNTGALIVNTSGSENNTVTYATTNLVKDTPTTVVSLAGAVEVVRVVVSGSGFMKVELKTGITSSETTKAVKFNSTANPNVEFVFPEGLNIASGSSIVISCTNLENKASPASDFAGYGTIVTV